MKQLQSDHVQRGQGRVTSRAAGDFGVRHSLQPTVYSLLPCTSSKIPSCSVNCWSISAPLRGFVLLLLYQALLGAVVYFAWPQDTRLDLTENPTDARKLVDLFFLGQYVLASLMAPSFAAGSITGEKERKTYEMLLASPCGRRRSCLASWSRR